MTRAVTVREPEYNDRDRAHLLADWDAENAPRGAHGVLVSEATDPKYNPYALDAAGSFVAEPVVDYAQAAIDREVDARRKAVSAEDDWPLLWSVRLEKSAPGDEVDPASGKQ